MSTQRCDVLILGAGVIGLSLAHELARAGREVLVLDPGPAGGGASHGNCGTITPSHALPLAQPGVIAQGLRWLLKPDAPLRIAPTLDPARLRWLWSFARRCNHADVLATAPAKATLLNRSLQLMRALIAEHELDCEFSAVGELQVFRSQALLDAAASELDLLREHGVPVEPWSGARVEADQPALKPGVVGGLYWPSDCHLRPDRYLAALAELARRVGVTVREQAATPRLERLDSGVMVHCGSDRLVAAATVVAAGAWSPRLLAALGLNLPVQPGKGYSITYTRPSLTPTRPLLLADPRVCVTTWASGFRLGSTMEFAGYDTRLNAIRLDALVKGARQFLHEAEGPERVESWWGWRPMTADDLPVIGASQRIPGLWLATGHGMLGMSMSQGTAELLAAQITGQAAAIDPKPYAPQRFGL